VISIELILYSFAVKRRIFIINGAVLFTTIAAIGYNHQDCENLHTENYIEIIRDRKGVIE